MMVIGDGVRRAHVIELFLVLGSIGSLKEASLLLSTVLTIHCIQLALSLIHRDSRF